MMEEDIDGKGYCILEDLYYFVRCSDLACQEFEHKKENKNEHTT
jgi:hypothetical protein